MDIRYEIYDTTNNQRIGTISGQQLRNYAGVGRNTPVFNETLVRQINEQKTAAGEPERIRSYINQGE